MNESQLELVAKRRAYLLKSQSKDYWKNCLINKLGWSPEEAEEMYKIAKGELNNERKMDKDRL